MFILRLDGSIDQLAHEAAVPWRGSASRTYHYSISRHASPPGGFLFHAALRFFEIPRVLMRFDHVASCILNVNHGIVRPAGKLCVSDCIASSVWPAVPQATMAARQNHDHLSNPA
jgi:hypothetical protein